MCIRNRESYFNLNPDRDDGIMKDGEFYLEMLFVERYAQNIAFWQKLLREYSGHDFETNRSNPRYVYIKMKEAEVRVNAFRRFDKAVMRKILTRLLELVKDN